MKNFKMANMFSGNQEKRIPKNFNECYKADSITKNLWLWCERLEKLGSILFGLIIIFGIITAIEASFTVTVEEVTHSNYYDTWTETETTTSFEWEVLLVSIVETALYAFIEYCVYHVLALLIGSLASMVQHTKITANIILYNSAKTEGIATADNKTESEETEEPEEDSSSKCSRQMHKDYISEIENIDANTESANWTLYESIQGYEAICNHCGKTLTHIKPNEKIKANYWRCLGCGKIIPNKTRTCSCGVKKEYL